MRKKILIMIDSLNCGGAEKSLVSLLPFLSAKNYDITVMTIAGGGIFGQFIPAGVKTEVLPKDVSVFRRFLYSALIRTPFLSKKHNSETYWKAIGSGLEAPEGEYDVAIAYQQGFPTFFVAEKVRAKRKICWVNTDLIKAGYSPDFCMPFYSKYDNIVAVTDTLRDSVIYPAYCKDKSRIVTCVDIVNESLIREMGNTFIPFEKEGKIHITTVGRLVEPKGYDLAISAAKILKGKGVDFIWHFVGGGPLHDELKAAVISEGLEECITLEGVQINPYPYMSNADIYVQTSRFEGFGITIAEAKILGCPIVSTDFPVIHHQIKDGVNGLIVKMTPESIAEGVMRLIQNPDLRTSLINGTLKEHNTTSETESAKVINLIES